MDKQDQRFTNEQKKIVLLDIIAHFHFFFLLVDDYKFSREQLKRKSTPLRIALGEGSYGKKYI